MTMTMTNNNLVTTAATITEVMPFDKALKALGESYGKAKALAYDTLLARLGATPAKALWESGVGYFAAGYRPNLESLYARKGKHTEEHNEAKGAKCPCRECKAQASAKAAFYALAKESGVTAPGSKRAPQTAKKKATKAKNAKAKAKRTPRTPTKADADKNGYRETLKKAIDGLDAATLEAMVLCWDTAVKAAQRGMKAKAMTMAQEWMESECYWGDGYVRADPSHATKIKDSNWEAGHMGQSFSPTCTYEFADGSKLEVGYSYAEVVG